MTKKTINPELPKGVFANKTGTYRARSHRNGKNHYLGTYKTIEEASAAYQEFATKYPPATNATNATIPVNLPQPKSSKEQSYDNLRAAWNSIFL